MTLTKNGWWVVRKVSVGFYAEVGTGGENLGHSIEMRTGATELVMFNKEECVKAGTL